MRQRPGLFVAPDDAPAPGFFSVTGLLQHEVLEDELAFASEKGSSARETGHFSQCRVGTGFDFDDIIERSAVRARKGPATSHVTPPCSILAC
jgi:hypothetical protein